MDTALQEIFFDAVSKGSVGAVEEFVSTHGKELAIELVNLSTKTGDTPLLLAVKGNHKEMVHSLFLKFHAPVSPNDQFLWQGAHYKAVPPFCAALLCSNKTCPYIVKSLILLDVLSSISPVILHSIMSSGNTRSQKIELLELIGATYILEDHFQNSTKFGLACWKQAMLLRQEKPLLPKADTNNPVQQYLENNTEIATLEELEGLAISPEENANLLKIQALLILYRILHSAHPIPSLYFLHHFSRFILYSQCQSVETLHVVDVMLFILESYHAHQWETRDDFEFVDDVFPRLSHAFSTLPKQIVSLESLLKTVWFASLYDSKLQQSPQSLQRSNVSVYDASLQRTLFEVLLDQQNSQEFKRYLSIYIPLLNPYPKVIGRLYFQSKVQKEFVLIDKIVEAGGNPNAVDIDDDGYTTGSTPLHFIFRKCLRKDYFNRNQFEVGPVEIARIQMLVDAGAHLDQVNSLGDTPLSLFKELEKGRAKKGLVEIPELQQAFSKILPLSCYAAQVLVKHLLGNRQKLPLELPRSIRTFVHLHVAPQVPL